MASVIRYYDGVGSVAVIGNYLPRQCGIATFTTDLVEALSAEAPDINCWAVAMNDKPEGYAYPGKVRFVINQNRLADYGVASEFLNIGQTGIVCVQHEYGIFGGPAGSHLLKLLGELRMPIVTTLHTVLKDPLPEYREVMNKLAELSDKLIVMSQKACDFLRDVYAVPEAKIAFIHHGIPDMPFIDPNFYKDKFGVEGKKVLLTFGLLSPNKGVEYVLQALPAVIKEHPDITYIILGATHPHIIKEHGEEYRISLQQLVRKLNISDHVIFHNRFVALKELCEFLGAADIYVTPYLEECQITSGTLAYAMGTGKAVISTPYWYATEMLADGRGIIVPFKSPGAIADNINDLLDNDANLHTMRKRAYVFCREATWKEVSRRYLEVFSEVQLNRSQHPRPRHTYIENIKSITNFELPEMKLDHLKSLTDDTGILQHATHTVPDRGHGYCTDDNARAMMVAAMGREYLDTSSKCFDSLCSQYLSFLMHSFNDENGRFRNFMTYDRQWSEEVGSEDAHGRALWGLGESVAFLGNPGQKAMSMTLFSKAIKAVEHFESPRAIAFALVGIHAYLQKFSGDSEVRRVREITANRLFDQFNSNATESWPWLENALNYANGKLSHALLLSGQWMQRSDMVDMGVRSLKWLLTIQTEDDHFVPIGNNGWYEKGGTKARFDQQPIEANAMIGACVEAYNITRDRIWIDNAAMCFNWFLGHNDLNTPLYDPKTGGCRDGLMADGINQNEGAESTLAWLLSLMTLQKLHADEILRQPSSQPIG
ncbi:MAG: glycosyltransferase family 4 protein [candidate division Zixibacteria bacterium]|nr:glycosyltransferase family 4 protein [candidate division Zixibacteria bacterium]MBU1471604.1 glycosyltransferase family 4 protein [candidate division Zixibacteria bacterium]MBU2626701.1 glycosyltransferase family 4 protein [candidate division Zixibacteria bacterium]